jgi:transposase
MKTRAATPRLDVSYGTANNLIQRFEEAGILEEVTGRQRYRRYRYRDYILLFQEEAAPVRGAGESLTTESR